VGPHGTELIAQSTVAIRAGLTARELGNTIHAHPTFGEAWMEADHAMHGEAIHTRDASGNIKTRQPYDEATQNVIKTNPKFRKAAGG
jgi:hypothetical protein